MKHRVRGWWVASTGCAALIAGCGGSAQDNALGGAGASSMPAGQSAGAPAGQSAGAPGSGNIGSGAAGAGNSTGVSPQGGGPGDDTSCEGPFNEVAAIWGDCPPTLCAGMAWADGCTTNPLRPIAGLGNCTGLTVITLDYGTHGKACYYNITQSSEPKLVGATAWDDVPHYCNNTSFLITTGSATTAACADTGSKIICDGSSVIPDASGGAGGEAGAGSSDTSPNAGSPQCFNALSHSCEPCCPEPECTGKPDGYPGYQCTLTSRPFCSCVCGGGEWSCAC